MLSDGYWIFKPEAWTWFSSVCALASVITGIVASVKRFIILIAISLASVFKLDATYFPHLLVSFDSGYTAFMSVAAMQHRHRSPVLSMAREKMFDNSKSTQAPSATTLRNRTRWQLALTLFNNPNLAQLRGHNLDAEEAHNTAHEDVFGDIADAAAAAAVLES